MELQRSDENEKREEKCATVHRDERDMLFEYPAAEAMAKVAKSVKGINRLNAASVRRVSILGRSAADETKGE